MTHVIRVYGIVQGVGFRPTVARHAEEFGIFGTVSNKGPYVEIIAQAGQEALEAFEEAIEKRPPQRAVILKITVNVIDSDRLYEDFQIVESEKTKGEILISPDIAICEDCKREMYDPANKRYLHPFINCTCCGPRLTILDALPYDRERTSMKEFPMCPDCQKEYYQQDDRRFDAQPVCCNDCGPVVYLLDPEHPDQVGSRRDQKAAITEIRRLIAAGGIAAIKGIGGYHLCCDATNEAAVSLLRERKNRPMKPLAVMGKNIEAVEKYCQVSEAQAKVLTGHQKPIILLEKREDCSLAPSVAPGNPKIGVMLPYAPIQLLLFDYEDQVEMPQVLVMTSANESGAPIVKDEADAATELAGLADRILAHNRKIRTRADDTVMDFYKDKPYMIRRSRGYAPLPVVYDMPEGAPQVVIGIGGELKNSFCIRVGNLCYMSPYIGDMEDIRTVSALKEEIQRFETLLEVQPQAVVCDMHPKYNTSLVAESLGLPVYKIQHHYAHVLSCMAENDYHGQVIGVSLDGTGYGEDGTIWGGEILIADQRGYQRAGHIKPFKQIGGNLSAKEGWRIAASMLYGLYGEKAFSMAESLGLCQENEARVISKMYDLNVNAVTSTSAGRLFDGVSAILGIRSKSTFEGEASTALQFAAREYEGAQAEGGIDREGQRLILDTEALVRSMVERRLAGEPVGHLAYDFHWTLAELIAKACMEIRSVNGLDTVALTGGCFQNTLLLKLTENMLVKNKFKILRHSMIPPNDGGIALGQSIYTGER